MLSNSGASPWGQDKGKAEKKQYGILLGTKVQCAQVQLWWTSGPSPTSFPAKKLFALLQHDTVGLAGRVQHRIKGIFFVHGVSQVGGWPKAPSLPCPLLPMQLWQHIWIIKSNGDKWVHIHLWQYNKYISKGDSGFPAGQSQLWLQKKGKSPWRILVLVEATDCSKWWPETKMNLQHRGLRKLSKWKEKAFAEKHSKWFFFFF